MDTLASGPHTWLVATDSSGTSGGGGANVGKVVGCMDGAAEEGVGAFEGAWVATVGV